MLFIYELWNIFTEMAPYLLFGFLIAGVLSVLIRPESVEKHLGGQGVWPIIKAAVLGVPLPLCSCGVIPVSASLRRHGAGRGAFIAFLISTPQTGVDSVLVTLSLLGPVFAVFRPLIALISGIVGGLLCSGEPPGEKEGDVPERCTDDCCDEERGSRFKRIITYGFVTLPRDIGFSLLVGLVLSALISVLVPNDFFVGRLGSGIVGMLLMLVLGIPVYVCATASIPIAAALMIKGVSPGAALVFLMTGPATNAANLAMIYRVTSGKTLLRYLTAVAGSALAAGFFFDYVLKISPPFSAASDMEMGSGALGNVFGLVLLAVLLYSIVGAKRKQNPGHEDLEHGSHGHTSAEEIVLEVNGMSCSHCADTVRKSLMEAPGVQSVDVDLKSGRTVITGNHLEIDSLICTIRELGYTACETNLFQGDN